MIRALVCAAVGHTWSPTGTLPLAGKIRVRCDRCGRVDFARLR